MKGTRYFLVITDCGTDEISAHWVDEYWCVDYFLSCTPHEREQTRIYDIDQDGNVTELQHIVTDWPWHVRIVDPNCKVLYEWGC